MTLASIRKALVAAAALGSEVLAAGLLSGTAEKVTTAAVAVIGTILTYWVRNGDTKPALHRATNV